MEKFENKPIEFARFKSYFTTKIVFIDGEYKCLKTTVWSGWDSLLHKWVSNIKTEKQILPLSELKEKPSKSVIQEIYVKRTGSNSMLKPIEIYVKIQKKIEVRDLESNVFLTQANGLVFMVDLAEKPLGCACAPLSQRGHALIKITELSETPLTQLELEKLFSDLKNPKIHIKPIIYTQNQSGELKMDASPI